jgi:hypothetical protein
MIHAGNPLTEIAEHLGNSVAVLSRTYAHVIKDMRGEPTTSVPAAIMSARASSQSREGSRSQRACRAPARRSACTSPCGGEYRGEENCGAVMRNNG